MSQLKQILHLFSQGVPIKGIARETGISRNAIKGYFRTIKSRELNLEDLFGLEDLSIEHVLRAPLKTEKSGIGILCFAWISFMRN